METTGEHEGRHGGCNVIQNVRMRFPSKPVEATGGLQLVSWRALTNKTNAKPLFSYLCSPTCIARGKTSERRRLGVLVHIMLSTGYILHMFYVLRALPQAKAQLIQARFDHLEARTLAQADLHEGSVDKLQEANRQVL